MPSKKTEANPKAPALTSIATCLLCEDAVEDGAVVEMVSVDCSGPAPMVPLAGAKEQVAPAGKLPQVKATVPVYPSCGVTVRDSVPVLPELMVSAGDPAAKVMYGDPVTTVMAGAVSLLKLMSPR